MNLMGPMLGHTGSALPESRFLLAEESFRLKELPGKVRCFNVALHRFVYMYGLCVSSCQRSSSRSVYIDVILWWPMVTRGLKCTCGFESIDRADGLPLCVMYSLVQWNWFSDVTDACNSGASSDHRGPISLHQAVHGIVQEDTCCQNIYCSCSVLGEEGGVCQLQVLCMQYVYVCFFFCVCSLELNSSWMWASIFSRTFSSSRSRKSQDFNCWNPWVIVGSWRCSTCMDL